MEEETDLEQIEMGSALNLGPGQDILLFLVNLNSISARHWQCETNANNVEHSISLTITQLIVIQSLNQSTNQSSKQFVNQSIKQSIFQAISQLPTNTGSPKNEP